MAARVRPNGAYKLLTTLLYYTPSVEPGKAPLIEQLFEEGRKPYLRVRSLRKLARALGTESKRVRVWLLWLESQGYLVSLVLSEDRKSAEIRLRRPGNQSSQVQV